jgi:RNA polymerase sigma-70 factor (ECF subfamily)
MPEVHEVADEDLVARIATGDGCALDILIRRHEGSALQVAFRFLGDRAEAEEIVQETFLRVYRNAHKYRPAAPFRAWMFRILTNLCRDSKKRAKPVYSDELVEMPDPVAGPEQSLDRKQRERAIALAILALPVNQRLALLFAAYEGLSYHETAEILGVSSKSVESLLVRARRTLRQALAGHLSR